LIISTFGFDLSERLFWLAALLPFILVLEHSPPGSVNGLWLLCRVDRFWRAVLFFLFERQQIKKIPTLHKAKMGFVINNKVI
jgi:hypothetical protein